MVSARPRQLQCIIALLAIAWIVIVNKLASSLDSKVDDDVNSVSSASTTPKIIHHSKKVYSSLSTHRRDSNRNTKHIINDDDDNWWRGHYVTPNPNMTHPHLGARHPNGTLGMIINPSIERLQPIPFQTFTRASHICPPDSEEHTPIEGYGGHMTLNEIQSGLMESKQYLLTMHNSKKLLSSRPDKILCIIYTSYTEEDCHGRLGSIVDTWGTKCDGFIGASNFTDHAVGAIDLPHEGPEEYSNMWQKIRTIWNYVYQNYINDFDYFYIAGDDAYVLMDNMRAYLSSPRVDKLKNGYLDQISSVHHDTTKASSQMRPRPLLFGGPYTHKGAANIGGGGGYILNQAALKLFGENGVSTWYPHLTDSREDLLISGFFRGQGVYVTDTRDESYGSRFWYTAEQACNFEGHGPMDTKFLRQKYGLYFPVGMDSASKQQVAFHMKHDWKRLRTMNLTPLDLMYRYHAYFEHWCENGQPK